MVYNRDSVWLHLYTAYTVQLLDGRYADESAEEAFAHVVDGPDCPIARCWSGEAFSALCREADFEAEFLGGYLSRHELDQLDAHHEAALGDQRLAAEHTDFLRELERDERGLPLWRGRYAGVGGSYVVRRARHDGVRG